MAARMATARQARKGPASRPGRTPRAVALPADVGLMLCTLVAEPFDDDGWIFEPKLDGLRVLCRCDGRTATIVSRNGKSQNFQFPEIVDALKESVTSPALLDGEVVCLDERGRSSFRLLQQRFHLLDPAEVRQRMEQYPAVISLFDVMHHAGRDLRALPLSERKRVLWKAVRWSESVRWTESVSGREGRKLLYDTCREAGEGIVGKLLTSTYYGGRSYEWVKVKCSGRQEFVVGGFTDPQRSRVGLGALLVGYYADDGKMLVYAGKVGTGYTADVLRDLRGRLDAIPQDGCPFAEGEPPRGPGVHWVKPRLVAEVEYAEWTQNGLLRQPRFEGLRMDKKATDVRRERPKPAAAVKSATKKKAGTRATTTATNRANAGPGETLAEYARKRDFSKTPEPKPEAGKPEAAKPGKAPVFVVQEHHATRLHYDLRLEVDGVLKSWAVTKQPSSDPSVKRLAVQTEDHPLAYADFAGDIPDGEYGAGHMEIWDRGTYAPADKSARPPADALAAGKMEFDLRGKRLKGRYALVRMAGRGRGENWLLIKMKDEHARRDAGVDESPAAAPRGGRAGSSSSRRKPTAALPSRATPVANGKPAPVDFTHVDKTWFPDARGGPVTKGDVIQYYLGVADKLIPHLRDRPITLERMPDGIGEGKPRFWQKNTPDYYPSWIPRVELPSEAGKPVRYALVNDVDILAYLVNQGAVTIHPFLSRVQDLDRPDYVLFDLDPGGAKFADVVKIARTIHDTLRGQDQEALVKTSGKSGLHVLVPWREPGDYDAARAWAMQTAESVISKLPDLATVERLKAERDGRVYIDVIQNARGHHAVPPYVLRPTPQATVSTPLDWKEVTPKLDPKKFTIRSAPKRFAGKPDRLLPIVAGA